MYSLCLLGMKEFRTTAQPKVLCFICFRSCYRTQFSPILIKYLQHYMLRFFLLCENCKDTKTAHENRPNRIWTKCITVQRLCLVFALVLEVALENDQIKTLALTQHCALHDGRSRNKLILSFGLIFRFSLLS